MSSGKVSIDSLIDIVAQGGTIRTGVDIFNDNGVLLLEREVLVKTDEILFRIKNSGIHEIPINFKNAGFVLDKDGKQIAVAPEPEEAPPAGPVTGDVEKTLRHITRVKKEAAVKYTKAKENIKKVISDIKNTGGAFDFDQVEDTVMDLFDFLTENDGAFSYLTREIFSYDDYLYNHSINVCTIGTAILKRLGAIDAGIIARYKPRQAHDISVGFFLHDVGKVLIPDEILNKKGRLTDEEFEIVKTHSFEKGLKILEINHLSNRRISNIVECHHGALYKGEERCYPDKRHTEIPAYVKVCKLADIYDAMTSKRCYKEAFSPISVVTGIFRDYARKDAQLQYLLHAFITSVGIYPPGSIIRMLNRQMVYIIDSKGPVVLPFTDTSGKTLTRRPAPIDLGDKAAAEKGVGINCDEPLIPPAEAFDFLPEYLKKYAVA